MKNSIRFVYFGWSGAQVSCVELISLSKNVHTEKLSPLCSEASQIAIAQTRYLSTTTTATVTETWHKCERALTIDSVFISFHWNRIRMAGVAYVFGSGSQH